MALSFIGKPISLISHLDIRYKGTLAGIDPQASTIQLENVYSMGTESRRPPHQYIAPVPEPFAFIVFRASEVKDLSVDDQAPVPPPSRSVHDDPAVLGASAPMSKPAYPPYAAVAQPNQQAFQAQAPLPPQPASTALANGLAPVPVAAAEPTEATPQQQMEPTQPPGLALRLQQQVGNAARNRNPIHSANASLETVERAMSDLRVSAAATQIHGGGRGGGRRGRGGRPSTAESAEQIRVPTTDFDFESSNAKFDKAAGAKAAKSPSPPRENGVDATGGGGGSAQGLTTATSTTTTTTGESAGAYNPKTSFFDSLSSSASTPAAERGNAEGRGPRRGGGGGGGRTRRDEEREKNVATFGEPGGVGLLGPGGYVGGWGGYSRRGSRPRRGGGHRGAGGGNQATAAAARG